MNTSKFLTAFLLLLPGAALSQPNVPDHFIHERSSPTPSARYEIAESPILARYALRLDRFTGRVCILAVDPNQVSEWESMTVDGLPKINPGAPRFQLFMSGHVARHALLIDSLTGRTWQLTLTGEKSDDPKWLSVPEASGDPSPLAIVDSQPLPKRAPAK